MFFSATILTMVICVANWNGYAKSETDRKSFKEPTRLFESIAVVGLHPNCDNQALQMLLFARKSEGSGKIRSALSGHLNSRVEPYLEPQVLFVYPPEKQLPLKRKDLLSFCFPGGIEIFYLVGFGFFCLESLLSLWVLQVGFLIIIHSWFLLEKLAKRC